MRIVLSEIAKLRKPQFYNLGGQNYLYLPVLNEDKQDKEIGADYIIAFLIGAKGPSRDGKVMYCAPGLKEPFPAEMRHRWR